METTEYTIKGWTTLQNKFINMWIEVFELTAEQEEQDWYDLAECNIVSRYFLTMDSFAKYVDANGFEYVSFYSGGCEWISILKMDEFLESYINKKP